MEELIKSTEKRSGDSLPKAKPHSSWLDTHTKLVARLESEYEINNEAKQESSGIRHYGFSIGGLNLLIAEKTSCEVLEDSKIYYIPLAPSWLVGTCNVHGDIVPIIDLEHILTGKARITELQKYKTFIIGEAENAIGLLLHRLPMPIHFKQENQLSNFSELPELIQPFIKSGYKTNQEVWICIDYASFIATLTNQQNT